MESVLAGSSAVARAHRKRAGSPPRTQFVGARQPSRPTRTPVLWEVRDFAELARAGAYMAGDRRVSPKERTRWRLTFRRLAADALAALHHQDSGSAEEAVALLIDLACETKRFDYFRSEDPMEAAQFVVSDAAATLWEFVRERHGFARFATVAATQLPRWESAYGWSRSGWGKLAEKEISLASVLGQDAARSGCVDHVCRLLPRRAEPESPAQRPTPAFWPSSSYPDSDYRRSARTRDLAAMALAAARAPGRGRRPRTGWTASPGIPLSADPSSHLSRRDWPSYGVTPTPPAH